MKRYKLFPTLFCLLFLMSGASCYALHPDFVYLEDIDQSIVQDLKYATVQNFIGRKVNGYESGRCILTKQAAEHLHEVQSFLLTKGYSLKVYDCYRPTRAVHDFVVWSKDLKDQAMKEIKYPRIDKRDVFKLGYVAHQSGHSRGSTIDLTVVLLKSKGQKIESREQSCLKPSAAMLSGQELNMGSDYDCLDSISHLDTAEISKTEQHHRLWLQMVMKRYGFLHYDKEWWHFTLANEPYPDEYFNFPVV